MIVAASVVVVLLAPSAVGSSDTATAAHRTGNEPRKEVLAGLSAAREAPIFFETRKGLPLQLRLDNGRDRLLHDLSGRERDLVGARVGGVPDYRSDRWRGPMLRRSGAGRGPRGQPRWAYLLRRRPALPDVRRQHLRGLLVDDQEPSWGIDRCAECGQP